MKASTNFVVITVIVIIMLLIKQGWQDVSFDNSFE